MSEEEESEMAAKKGINKRNVIGVMCEIVIMISIA